MKGSKVFLFCMGPCPALGPGCITAWYGSCNALNRKALQRVVKTAQNITRTELPSMEDLYSQRLRKKSLRIIKDPHLPSHKLFSLLPSGRRYRSIRTKTTRFRDSYISHRLRPLLDSMGTPLNPIYACILSLRLIPVAGPLGGPT